MNIYQVYERDGTPSLFYIIKENFDYGSQEGDMQQLTHGFKTYEEAKNHFDEMYDFYTRND